MKREEVLPFLKSFVTVTLTDGSAASGYISNYSEITEGTSDDIDLKLMNGLLVEHIPLREIALIRDASRENTAAIPVINLKDGY